MNKKHFGMGLLFAILLFFSTPTYAQAPIGEVYVLKSLDVNPIYKGQTIYTNMKVENVQWGNGVYAGANGATITLSVMEEDGNPVPGISFPPVDVTFTNSTHTYQFTLETPGPSPILEVGKTYVVVGEIVPYVDSGGNASLDEKVVGNNRARKTFTVINPPVTFSIPDMPFALVVLTFSIVLGWLFTARVRIKHHLKK